MLKLKRSLKIALATLFFTGVAQASVESTIISQPPGNSWYTYGTTFSRVVPDATNNEYKIKLIPRGGGMTNPIAVNDAKADFGFVTANTVVWARDGITDLYKDKKSENMRLVLGNLQEAYTIIIARKSWVDQTGNNTLEKIVNADKVVIAMKPTGSQVPIIADFLFKTLGTDLDTLKAKGKVIQISGGQASQMLRDNTVDVYIDNVPAMHPNLTEMTLTTDVVYIPHDKKQLDELAKLGLPTGTMPAGTYQGQTADYVNPVSATTFIAGANVKEETVYNVTKALVENEKKLKESSAALASWNPANIEKEAAELNVELHPGAAKYFREQGWLK